MSVPLARVGDLAMQIRGVTYGKSDASKNPLPGYLPVLRAGNITDDGLIFDDLVYVSCEKISDKQMIRRHDVMLAASSGSLSIVGKAAASSIDFDGGFGAFCKVLRPSTKVDPRYFAQFFKTQDYRRRISALAAGANINNLRSEHLDEMQIPLPPIAEQRRIAEVLDRAESLRAKRRTALAQLDSLAQSIFLDMFGDPNTNPRGLPFSTIADIASQVTDGEHLTPERILAGIKLLSARNIRDGFIDVSNVDHISDQEYERISRRCKPTVGDILISCSGTIGRVATVQTHEPLSLVRSVALVRPNGYSVVPKFVEYYLRTPAMKVRMVQRANASSQANLFQGQLRDLPIYLPPLALQQTFARRVAAIESLKITQRAALVELNVLFASLQHRAFRGEL